MKILEIELLSNDLIKTEKFYSKILGFETEKKSTELLKFKIGNSKLTFKKTEIENPVYHFAFEIPQNLFEQSIIWISNKTELIKFENNSVITEFENWNAKATYFFDNNGNILEFIARFDNEKSEKTEFDVNQIQNISEIAFVTKNVTEFAETLIQKYGLKYFAKQIQRNDFSVIGENTGLFILVEENRTWYPTQIKAEKYLTKVKMKIENEIIEFENK